jgi:alpha-tubulin suppressor-like RCC1 family protein
MQNPGLIVAGTSNGSLFLARVAMSDGSFDRSFRAGHLVVAGLGAFVPLDVATFPDTRILVLGRTDHGNEVVGFTHDGELDPTFGAGGIATIPGPARATGRLFFSGFDLTFIVAPDLYRITLDGVYVPTTPDPDYSPPDSPAVEAGAIYYAQGPEAWVSNRRRLSTFVDNGGLPGTPTAIAVSRWDNHVYQGGSLPTGAGTSDLFVRAFLPGGAIDSHFGRDGTVRLDISQVDGVSGIIVSYDRLVVVGSARRSGGRTDLSLVMLHLDGTPFPTLGNDGVWTTPVMGPSDGQVGIGGYGLGDAVIVPGHTPAGGAAIFRASPSSLPPGHPLAWGWNGAGQLGDGTTGDRHSPVSTSGLIGALSVAAGGYHSLAVSADGNATSWGWNPVGELGDGTTNDRSTPAPVLSDVVAVSAGMLHSLALRADGTVWAWGWNGVGQLGDGTTTDRHTPTKVANLTGVVAIAAGGYHSLAVRADGTVWAWGWNGVGQLGDGTLIDRLSPVQTSLTGVASVAGGLVMSMALSKTGTLFTWGWDVYGELGRTGQSSVPGLVSLPGSGRVVSMAAGGVHALAVLDDGTVAAWGWNGVGQLGTGTTSDSPTPVRVPGLDGIAMVSAGMYHSMALSRAGTVSAWGWNVVGQLGGGSTDDLHAPVSILLQVRAISAGMFHSLAL